MSYQMKDIEKSIKKQLPLIDRLFDARSKRLWAASLASVIGRGGSAVVSRATGISP
jgi:hypothetical protein